MKNLKKHTILAVSCLSMIFVLNLSSCKKDEPEDNNTIIDKTTIAIASPQEGATCMGGDTVFIKADIVSTRSMHGYEIFIRNKSMNDSLVFHKQVHDHNTSILINDFWVNDVSAHSDMELELKMIMDHDGNTQIKKCNFHCIP